MTPEVWRDVRARFDELVELAPDEREHRLREIASTDPDLHAAVVSLLGADATADHRLKRLELPWQPDGEGPHSSDEGSRDPFNLVGRTISHFEIVEPLASGGMGVLYRALDTRLQRTVALKFPWPWYYLHDPAVRQRFLREGRTAAALDHPNLCNIYEVDETPEGQVFLAMPLYQGETLKARLERGGPLAVGDVIGITRQVVHGLAAVHAAEVVHRDLKPANVMLLPDGTVKILDFGLAKVGKSSLTASATRLGTATYMAPEQIRGQPVDARTDLWALGVMLYEMLTGHRPFEGDDDIAVAHAILHREPVPPSRLRPDVPPALEDAILDLLCKDQRRRTRSTAVLEGILETLPAARPGAVRRAARSIRRASRQVRPAVGPTVLIALVAISLAAVSIRWSASRNTSRPLTSNPDAQLFYDRGREYEGRAESPQSMDAAASLYQRALALDPDFALARARLALTYAAMYTAGYDRTPAGRDRIRTEAEAALRLQPDLPEGFLALGHYWDVGFRDNQKALAAFERALPGLSNSPELHAALARLYRAQNRWDDAVSKYQRALELNPMMLSVAMDLSFTYSMLRRYDEGIALLDRLIAFEPENHRAKLAKGYQVIRRDGTPDTMAAMLARIPAEWDDHGAGVWARTVLARLQRRPAEALALLNATQPDWSFGMMFASRHRLELRAQVLEELGDTARARADYLVARDRWRERVAANPDNAWWHILLGLSYAGLNQRSEAETEARRGMELLPISKDATVGPLVMVGAAEIFARVGNAPTALELLDQLLGMPAGANASVPLLRLDPTWDPLRKDPRFEVMLQRHAPKVISPP